jgi:adenylosuccinate lyase
VKLSLLHPLHRYASDVMLTYWSPEWQVIEERALWLQVLTYQIDRGAPIADARAKAEAYAQTSDVVDLNRIRHREMATKHDVKARIEEANCLATQRYYGSELAFSAASLELIHIGMTSADVVDNISLIRMRQIMGWLLTLVGTSLDQDQGTANLLTQQLDRLPFRGIKGPVGTQQDMVDILGVDGTKRLDEHLANAYGFHRVLDCVGQVYPRSIDTEVGATLMGVIQRRQPWHTIANGYFRMVTEYSGNQWNEGDVSTSVIRRVALPGMFIAAECAIRKVKP